MRNLPHIKDLTLADEQFDVPGKVELLLGQNVWRHLFLEGKSKGKDFEPEAWETVFGWTVLGSYKPSSQEGAQQAITHVVTSEEAGLTSNQLLSKFWKLEEPSVYEPTMAPTEMEVEKHYENTHSYDVSQKKYVVLLPRSQNVSDLGESRTQALNRRGPMKGA